MSRAYYDLQAQIRPGWLLANSRAWRLRKNVLDGHTLHEVPNPAKWKDPPHVAFANMIVDAKSVRAFANTYGPLIATLDEIPDEGGDGFEINLTLLGYIQDEIREVWRGKRELIHLWVGRGAELAIRTFLLPCRIARPTEANWHDYVVPGRSGELLVDSCLAYLRMLLHRDLESGRARVCKNPECVTPYFVAGREDKEFCCHQCAVDVNVPKWRKRMRKGSKKNKKSLKRRKP